MRVKFFITVELLGKCDWHDCAGKRKSLNLNLYTYILKLQAFCLERDYYYRTINTITLLSLIL